jgi:iron(III) transport system substrate-binding protein
MNFSSLATMPWMGAVLTALALGGSVTSAQAQSSGVVNAICATDQSWCELAAQEFSKATGIKVNQTVKATGEALAQLRAESSNPKTDLWWGGVGDVYLQAAEMGLLQAYRPDYLNQLHDWSVQIYELSGNRVGGFYTSAIGFGWNTEVLKKRNLPEPKCWADLIKPVYKGEIETSSTASSGTAYTILTGLIKLMGEEQAFDYLKKLHKNTTSYTRSGTAQAPNVARGEVAVGVSFMFGFDMWQQKGSPVKSAAPCEGTSYEIGGIGLVKGARNEANAKRYYDFLMSATGQALGGKANSLQVPANKTFKLDPRIPLLDNVKLVKHDFVKFGKSEERSRLTQRWQKEVESAPR